MIINRQSSKVNQLEVVDGELVDFGEVTVQTVQAFTTFHCEDEEYLDFLIDEFEKTLVSLYEKRNNLQGKGYTR